MSLIFPHGIHSIITYTTLTCNMYTCRNTPTSLKAVVLTNKIKYKYPFALQNKCTKLTKSNRFKKI